MIRIRGVHDYIPTDNGLQKREKSKSQQENERACDEPTLHREDEQHRCDEKESAKPLQPDRIR